MTIRQLRRNHFALGACALLFSGRASAEVTQPLPAVLPPPADQSRLVRHTIVKKRAAPKVDPLAARLDGLIRQTFHAAAKPLKIEIKTARQTVEGYFSSVSIDGAPVKVGQIEIASIWLRAKNLRLDVSALKAGTVQVLSGQVNARVVISEGNMTSLLAKQPQTAGMNLKAHILSNGVEIAGRSTTGLLRGDVRLFGVILPKPGAIAFQVNAFTVNGSPVSALLKAIAQAQVNAALKVEDIPFKPLFKSVSYGKDGVTVTTY
jgi:hypothetical protein